MRCNNNILERRGKEEERINNDSQDLILCCWIHGSGSTVVGKTGKEVWNMCGMESRILF